MAKAKKKPAAGRPTVAKEEKRSILIRVLATPAEHAVLQDAAKAAGMPISTWLRGTGIEKARQSKAG